MSTRRENRGLRREPRLYDMTTFARLCRARDFLGDCYRERVTLEQAAKQACLSPFHFNRVFAEVFGETPHEFVTRIRVEEAKRLLLAENRSVTDICLDIGYESLGSFSAKFHSMTGHSPSEFRRQARIAFGGFGAYWPLYYIPTCYQHFYVPSPAST